MPAASTTWARWRGGADLQPSVHSSRPCRVSKAATGHFAVGGRVVGFVDESVDRTVDLGIRAGHDEEPDVAGPTSPHEAVRALRRVGAHHEGTNDECCVVAGTVTRRDLCGQLRDGRVEDPEVVGHRIGAGVART